MATLDPATLSDCQLVPSSVPHLGLAIVDAHARMDLQILANCSVHVTHSVRISDNENVIQIRVQVFGRHQFSAFRPQCSGLTH